MSGKMIRAIAVLTVCMLMLMDMEAVEARDLRVAPISDVQGADGSAARPFPSVAAAVAAGAGEGDRVLLAAGDYGRVVIRGVRAKTPLVVLPADPSGPAPRLSSLRVRDSENVHLTGLLVEGGDGALTVPLVQIDDDLEGIRLEGLTVRSGEGHVDWSGEEWIARARQGIVARGPRPEIVRNSLGGVRHGITVLGRDAKVVGNRIDGFSGDGVRALADQGLYERNRIANCFHVDGNHADGFQSWTRGPDGDVGKGVVRDVVLRGNEILNYTGRRGPLTCNLQAVGLFDGMFENWLIEDNLIEVDMWHGITVMGGRGTRVSGNTVRNIGSFPPGPPAIRIIAHKDGRAGGGNLIEGNLVVGKIHADPRVTVVRGNKKLAPVR